MTFFFIGPKRACLNQPQEFKARVCFYQKKKRACLNQPQEFKARVCFYQKKPNHGFNSNILTAVSWRRRLKV